MISRLQCGRFELDLSVTKIMGVLNCTPDSFSDGGLFVEPEKALARAREMKQQGADIIDIGAESTRPGASPVTAEEEIRRLDPVVRALVQEGDIPISVDTRHAQTMRAMLALGVDMINDISALSDNGALNAVAQSNCAVCLMHMRGEPKTMQNHTDYQDVVAEVATYLQKRLCACRQQGIAVGRLLIDPGFGFGKTPEQNMALLARLDKLLALERPVLIGASRKSTIGHYLKKENPEERGLGSVILAALSAYNGAGIVRVHDVGETKEALLLVQALKRQK